MWTKSFIPSKICISTKGRLRNLIRVAGLEEEDDDAEWNKLVCYFTIHTLRTNSQLCVYDMIYISAQSAKKVHDMNIEMCNFKVALAHCFLFP